ncbi:MAG: lipoyl synthase, partial [Planctomycetota bacterium]
MLTLAEKTQTRSLQIRDCGLADYREVLQLQHELRERRVLCQIPNTVLIAEHPPVITLGARQDANKLLVRRSELAQEGIDVVDIRRGGGATAHNPGQVVFYPILNLKDFGIGINEYIRELEAIGSELLEWLGIRCQRRKGLPGLWVGKRKIASIGVRVSKSVTYHGMAINIQNDLSIFDFFVPCGINGVKITSALKETGKHYSMSEVKQKLGQIITKHFPVSNQPRLINKKRARLPGWLKRPLPAGQAYNKTSQLLGSLGLQTICFNANCPNRGECWGRGTATVLILGNVCTRNCKFCSVATGRPEPPDHTEPDRVAEMAARMGLKYLVITSVNRDDLPDGGAGHFRDCINKVRQRWPDTKFEILTPDFRDCQAEALEILQDSLPFVFSHNIETVAPLYAKVRGGGNYRRSLNLLKMAKEKYKNTHIKSSIMLGLGETDAEIEETLKDLRKVGCDRITIGQYLKPSKDSLEVAEYIPPEKFDQWRQRAAELGFSWVISG